MSHKVSPEMSSDVTEIIETTIDSIELLTRAFEVIRNVCEEEGAMPRTLRVEIPVSRLN